MQSALSFFSRAPVSIRAKIIALFTVILVLSMGIAAALGAGAASRAVESAVRDRAVEVARAVRSDLDLSRDLDPARAADRLAAALRQHRGVRSAELIIRQPGKDDVVRMQYGPNGPEATFDQQDYSFPAQVVSEVVGDGDDRVVRVELPVKDSFSHPVAAIRLEASLSEAERLGRSQGWIFAASTALAAFLVFLAFTISLNRMLVRPLSALAGTVEGIESGALDAAVGPRHGAPRRDRDAGPRPRRDAGTGPGVQPGAPGPGRGGHRRPGPQEPGAGRAERAAHGGPPGALRAGAARRPGAALRDHRARAGKSPERHLRSRAAPGPGRRVPAGHAGSAPGHRARGPAHDLHHPALPRFRPRPGAPARAGPAGRAGGRGPLAQRLGGGAPPHRGPARRAGRSRAGQHRPVAGAARARQLHLQRGGRHAREPAA